MEKSEEEESKQQVESANSQEDVTTLNPNHPQVKDDILRTQKVLSLLSECVRKKFRYKCSRIGL